MKIEMKCVIDTNVFIVSISEFSKYHWLYRLILDGRIQVCITNEILMEYEEMLNEKLGSETAASVIRTLLELENVFFITIYFKLGLINTDADDNKFVDCAFTSNADVLVSNDKHFRILNEVKFPKINLVTLEQFKEGIGATE